MKNIYLSMPMKKNILLYSTRIALKKFLTRCTDNLRQAADLYEHIHFDRVLDRLKLRLEQKIEAIINNHNFELKYKIIKDDNEESF